MEESEDKEPTVLDLVFSGDRPVFLRMDEKEGKERSLIHKAKELGVYRNKMKCVEVEKLVEKHWIKKCGGYEEYLKAKIFCQEKQIITRTRKELASVKRKKKFAADHQTEKKITSKKRARKTPLTGKVRKRLSCPCTLLLSLPITISLLLLYANLLFQEAVQTFGKYVIYLDLDEIPKCRCNHKHIHDWD